MTPGESAFEPQRRLQSESDGGAGKADELVPSPQDATTAEPEAEASYAEPVSYMGFTTRQRTALAALLHRQGAKARHVPQHRTRGG